MRLLIIESDLVLLGLILDNLSEDYLFDVASTWSKATLLLHKNRYQGLLCSWAVFRNIYLNNQINIKQFSSSTPILILVEENEPAPLLGHKHSYISAILRKPFSVQELQLRLEAICEIDSVPSQKMKLMRGLLNLDSACHRLKYLNGCLVLSQKECALLALLMKHAGQNVSKAMIAHLIWENEDAVVGNRIEQHISALRRKLKLLTGKNPITTLRGNGYYWQGLN